MVRLAIRRTPSLNARYTLNRGAAVRSKMTARKHTTTKNWAAPKTTAAPIFIGAIRKLLTPMRTELNRFEMQLKKQVKSAKSHKFQLKTEAALQRRFNTMHSNIMKFKTKWFGRFNALNRHANKSVQMSVNQLKTEIEDLRKSAKRNLTILNRYTKTAALKKGYKRLNILSPAQTKAFEMKFNGIHTNVEKFKTKIEQYLKQIKAMKMS